MTAIIAAHARFLDIVSNAVSVTYNPKWLDSLTGYFNGAIRDANLLAAYPKGTILTSVDPQGRKLLLVGTSVGFVVVFERHVAALVFNMPTALKLYLKIDLYLTVADLDKIFGAESEHHSFVTDFEFFLKKIAQAERILKEDPLEAVIPVEDELALGTVTTCQFGNPGDSDFEAEKSLNVPVTIIGIGKSWLDDDMKIFLVQKVDDLEYIGTAQVSHSDHIQGALYCTNARTFGSKAQGFTGIKTFRDAVRSLGGDFPTALLHAKLPA